MRSGGRGVLDDVREDARLYCGLRCPQRPQSAWTLFRIGMSSRGLLALAGHRAVQVLMTVADAAPERRFRRGALRGAAILLAYALQMLTKSEIDMASHLEPGVYVSDRGNVVLGARRVGRGTLIHHRVTIGVGLKKAGTPEIGERVWIGPDTVIAGALCIGDGSTIMPATVLTRSVPPNSLVEGNPARIVRRDFDNSALRRSTSADGLTV